MKKYLIIVLLVGVCFGQKVCQYDKSELQISLTAPITKYESGQSWRKFECKGIKKHYYWLPKYPDLKEQQKQNDSVDNFSRTLNSITTSDLSHLSSEEILTLSCGLIVLLFLLAVVGDSGDLYGY